MHMPRHLHLFTHTFLIPHVFYCIFIVTLRGLYIYICVCVWNEMPPVNLCSSADLYAKQFLSGHSLSHTYTYTCTGLQVLHRGVITARKWFKAIRPGRGGRRDGIDILLDVWLGAFRSVWYYRWTGTPSGVVCPPLTPQACQGRGWWNLQMSLIDSRPRVEKKWSVKMQLHESEIYMCACKTKRTTEQTGGAFVVRSHASWLAC